MNHVLSIKIINEKLSFEFLLTHLYLQSLKKNFFISIYLFTIAYKNINILIEPIVRNDLSIVSHRS